jgi:hypothetical protein
VFAPTPSSLEHAVGDFGRFSEVINQQIALVEMDGTVREGIVQAASASELTMRFGSGEKTFQRDVIASAERLRDRRVDGTIKGAIFGTVMGLLVAQAYQDNAGAAILGSAVVYAGLGFALDAAQTHREPIYRGTPKAAAKISFRF